MTSAPVSLNKKDAKAAEDITAPEDFIGADQAVLRHLDHSARCSICYELYASPVLLTGCSHTFCSSVRYLQSSLRSKLAKLTECQKCIRVHLDSNPGKPMCPTCGTATSETALKPNKALEEMTQKWAAARNLVLDLVASANKQKAPSAQSSSRHRKRAAADDGDDKTHKRRKSASASRAASPGGSDLEIVASPRADDRRFPL